MNNQTKNHRDFIRKFANASFPFKAIIEGNKGFKKQLFSEFIQTVSKPDFYLYRAQYLTDEEISADTTEWVGSENHTIGAYSPKMEKRMHGIRANFDEQYKTINESFFSFDFEAIQTINTLKEIESQRSVLRNEVFEDEGTVHYEQRTEDFANSVNRLLTGLKNQLLAIKVFDAILAGDENIHISIATWHGDTNPQYVRKQKLLKTAFDKHLSRLFIPVNQVVVKENITLSSKERLRQIASISSIGAASAKRATSAYIPILPNFDALKASLAQNPLLTKSIASGFASFPNLNLATSFTSLPNASIAASMKELSLVNAEVLKKAVASISVGWKAYQIGTLEIAPYFNRIFEDPAFKRRFELLREKQRLNYATIEEWKGYLNKRMDEMPFEPFRVQFEYAFYDFTEHKTNDEIAALTSDDFVELLKDVAARIVVLDRQDREQRESKYRLELGTPVALAAPSIPLRSEDTERKARQAVTLYENKIAEIIQQERGKLKPLSNKEIVAKAISKYQEIARGQNLGTDQRTLCRYLRDIGKQQTALKYGRQLVGQLRKP